jgi:hypothetical protein
MKGVLIMTTVPFTQCCTLLAVDAKTLRQWLKHSHLSLQAHRTDARIKCLTIEQVQQLAALHGRSLTLGGAPIPHQVPVPLVEPEKLTHLQLVNTLSSTFRADCELIDKLSSLEAIVITLQQQVTGLALELLQERTLRYEQRLQTLEALVQSTEGQQVMSHALQAMGEPSQRENATSKEQDRSSTQRRTHPSLLPLIEYGAGGTYVVICPQEGELLITPDSPEWFAWLATLSSFRFVGQQGRLSTYRNKGRSCWLAYRRIHCRRYEYALGATSRLTTDHLERMAATLQSHVPLL